MNKLVIVSALFAVGLLAGCNNNLKPAENNSSDNSSLGSETPVVNNSEAQKMLNNLEAALRAHSVENTKVSAKASALPSGLLLNNSQINTIMGLASGALGGAGLSQSNDLSAIIPVLIGGATQGVGQIGLPTGQATDLLALIGNGSLSSILGSVPGVGQGGALPTGLIQTLTGSLFQNLPLAGIGSGNMSQVAGSLISSLTGNLGNTGLPVGDLSTLLQSISSGAMLGLGNSGLNAGMLSGILSQIGMGSVTGISGINVPGGMNLGTLQTLLAAFTSGSNLGLGQIAGSQGLNASMITALLGSLTQGQSTALPSIGLGSSQTQMMMMFLQMLMGSMGKH